MNSKELITGVYIICHQHDERWLFNVLNELTPQPRIIAAEQYNKDVKRIYETNDNVITRSNIARKIANSNFRAFAQSRGVNVDAITKRLRK